MYTCMHFLSKTRVYIVTIMDELLKGMRYMMKIQRLSTSITEVKEVRRKQQRRLKEQTREIGELKEECPGSQVKFHKIEL